MSLSNWLSCCKQQQDSIAFEVSAKQINSWQFGYGSAIKIGQSQARKLPLLNQIYNRREHRAFPLAVLSAIALKGGLTK